MSLLTPQNPNPCPDQRGRTRALALGALLAAALMAGAFVLGRHQAQQEAQAQVLVGDRYRVIRTPGGLLEVSTLRRQEALAWQTRWTCPVSLCDGLPTALSQISGQAHYTWRIPLASYWVLERLDSAAPGARARYRLQVPAPQPSLPVAVDLASIRVDRHGTLLAPSGPTQQALQTLMQPELTQRALSAAYRQAQRPSATRTVQEFARRWMRDGDLPIAPDAPIEVVFEGDGPP